MEAPQSNYIIFKFEEYDSNETSSAEIKTLPAVRVSGTAYVSVINLLENTRQVIPREPVGAPANSLYTINDTTDTLLSVKFTTNSEGDASIDLRNLLTNATFIKFYQKYKSDVTLNITIEIPKTIKYNVFIDNVKITPSWASSETGIEFRTYDYYGNDETIILSLIEDKATTLATLRQTYKTVEENYLLVRKQYEGQVIGEVDLEIDTAEAYEPKTFKSVITRLLEFQIGTVQPAIEYTKTAKLTTENNRLTIINNLVNLLAKQYPDITIEDGEGIPYNK